MNAVTCIDEVIRGIPFQDIYLNSAVKLKVDI